MQKSICKILVITSPNSNKLPKAAAVCAVLKSGLANISGSQNPDAWHWDFASSLVTPVLPEGIATF
jgi:hypothetical protein